MGRKGGVGWGWRGRGEGVAVGVGWLGGRMGVRPWIELRGVVEGVCSMEERVEGGGVGGVGWVLAWAGNSVCVFWL